MNKIILIIKREFLSRVKKRSFLLATILVPLIFPAVFGLLIYLKVQDEQNAEQEAVQVLIEQEDFKLEDTKRYKFTEVPGPLSTAVTAYKESSDMALIYIPEFTIEQPTGFVIHSKNTLGPSTINGLENLIEDKIRDKKLVVYDVDPETLEKLRTRVSLESIITQEGEEEGRESSAGIASAIGYVTGFLIYIFMFAYGGQVMQGVIEEKNSKIVEVIVSTVKPFQLMLGKVIGVASVGLVQIVIWIALMGTFYVAIGAYFGISNPRQEMTEQVTEQIAATADVDVNAEAIAENSEVTEIFSKIESIPFGYILFSFVFYFLAGYLMYGALFAAVGSAVDTPADAQQFMFPIMLPIILGFMGMALFVFDDPHGTVSFWLSIIPLTSPIVMMGRVGFGVPAWELILSMVLLVGGFVFTIWFAGRIYRVGILMHGTKVNYKILAKWFMMKN